MTIPNEAVLLRIYIGESDKWQHQPLYEALVLAAREAKLAGATVLRGPMGFGKSSRVHTTEILQLSMDLPLVIELVDSEEKINAFLPLLDPMIGGGLVTLALTVISWVATISPFFTGTRPGVSSSFVASLP